MANRSSRQQAPPVCPVCGEDVPANALACPECGADHESGWREGADAGALGLPDDEFDYDEFTAREFGTPARSHRIKPVWWITAIILIVGSLVLFLVSLSR